LEEEKRKGEKKERKDTHVFAAHVFAADKRGLIEGRMPWLLDRLGIDPEAFIAASTTLLTRFGSAVGTPESLTACCAARPVVVHLDVLEHLPPHGLPGLDTLAMRHSMPSLGGFRSYARTRPVAAVWSSCWLGTDIMTGPQTFLKEPIVAEQPQQTVTIDGTEYNLAELSENARNQLHNLRVTDQEIARLQQQLAIYQTARTAYARALREELPKAEH